MDEDGNPIKKHHTAVESLIRWRTVRDENGNEKRESNARFVKWDDGSIHLMIGGEVLDVKEQALTGEHHYYCARQPGFLQTHGMLCLCCCLRCCVGCWVCVGVCVVVWIVVFVLMFFCVLLFVLLLLLLLVLLLVLLLLLLFL